MYQGAQSGFVTAIRRVPVVGDLGGADASLGYAELSGLAVPLW